MATLNILQLRPAHIKT